MRKGSGLTAAKRGLWLAAAAAVALGAPMSGTAPVAAAQETAPVDARWSVREVGQLIKVIESARQEGLDPALYDIVGLRAAAANGAGPMLDVKATAAALALAHDYYFGRVRDRESLGWLIERSPDEGAQLPDQLNAALSSGRLASFYRALLPNNDRYEALRTALADAPDRATRDRLRANMERWRWMPRSMVDNYLYVNVPSYQLQVVEGGSPSATYAVVVGKPQTPTPMLASPASSLVVNPWWNVPVSIVKSSNLRPGKAGYVFKANGSGSWSVRQPPGPRNALGRIKFNLVNDQAIYLHDTPAKAAFTRDSRALSHGCIRVKDIDQLAAQLMSEGGDGAKLEDALAGNDTATLRLPQTWQVYIVYFTVDQDASGQLVNYDDLYGTDSKIVAQLDGRPMQIASR